MSRRLVATALALSALASAGAAQAHAHLVTAAPAARSTAPAPHDIRLSFNEAVVPQFSGMTVTTGQGKAVVVTTMKSPDRKMIMVLPRAALAPGEYTVAWHAVTADTHRTEGKYVFTVR